MELAYYTGAFNSLSHKIKEEYGSLPDEDLDDRGDEDDEKESVMELGDNGNEKGNSSFEDDEELDLENLQITQERMDEYSRSVGR